jgi:diacylglycerol kinase (ATP)
MTDHHSRRYLFLFNPNAGLKSGVTTGAIGESEVRGLISQLGLEGEFVVTRTEAEAVQTVRQAVQQRVDVVVGIGGDGTQGLIARELIGTETALAMIPGGSIMNIGRMLGIPRDVEQALEIIAGGHIRQIDVGQARGQVFFEVASVGLNAPVFQAAQRFDAGERRSILEAIWVAIRYRPARMTIRMDEGVVVTRALMVTVANGSYTGLGFTVAPHASLDDGLFDVTLFRRFSRTGLLLHFAKIAFGRRTYSPNVTTFRSRVVEVLSASPLPCRADSQDLGETPVLFTCKPGCLRVICAQPV